MEKQVIHGDKLTKRGLLVLIAHQCGYDYSDSYTDLQLMKSIFKGLCGRTSTGINKKEVMDEIDYTMQVEGSSPVVPSTKLTFDLTYLTFTFSDVIDTDMFFTGDFYVGDTKEGKYKAFTIDTNNGLEIAIAIKGTTFNTQCAVLYQVEDNKFKIKPLQL